MQAATRIARFKFSIRQLLVLTIVVALTICGFLWMQKAISTRVLVAIDLPTNQRFRVLQTLGGEPFDTKIYFDSGDGQWGFYYYEHEDWYWSDAKFELNNEWITVFRDSEPTIQLNAKTGKCFVTRLDGWSREYDAPLYYTTTLLGSA